MLAVEICKTQRLLGEAGGLEGAGREVFFLAFFVYFSANLCHLSAFLVGKKQKKHTFSSKILAKSSQFREGASS